MANGNGIGVDTADEVTSLGRNHLFCGLHVSLSTRITILNNKVLTRWCKPHGSRLRFKVE